MQVLSDRVVVTMTQDELTGLVDALTMVCSFVDELISPRNTIELRRSHAALIEFHRRLCADDIKGQLRRALSPLSPIGGA